MNFLEFSAFLHDITDHVYRFRGTACMGNEDSAGVDPFCLKALLGVTRDSFIEVAAEFAPNHHLPVPHLNAGFQLENLSPLGSNGRTAATLGQVIQLVNYEARINFWHYSFQPPLYFLWLNTLSRHSGGVTHQMAAACGKVLGINDIDIIEFFRSQGSIGVA